MESTADLAQAASWLAWADVNAYTWMVGIEWRLTESGRRALRIVSGAVCHFCVGEVPERRTGVQMVDTTVEKPPTGSVYVGPRRRARAPLVREREGCRCVAYPPAEVRSASTWRTVVFAN